MPEGCEGGGEAQGGGYGGSASCGSAPRCRTLFQARLRGCKFGESGLLENEPTAPAEQAHTTQRQ